MSFEGGKILGQGILGDLDIEQLGILGKEGWAVSARHSVG
jgi:hypothetical protein